MDVDQANEGYRSFARGGIAAVITINTLALGAALSQIIELQQVGDAREIYRSFIAWIFGVVLGVLTWFAAALAAQAFANGAQVRERLCASTAFVTALASLGCFAYGAWRIAIGVLILGAD